MIKGVFKAVSKKRKIAGDLVYTIGATVVMNAVLNLIVYPLINYRFGKDVSGSILNFIGVIYIIPQAVGASINNTRLVMRKTSETTNGDYTRLLSFFCVISAILCGWFGFAKTEDIVFSIFYGLFSIIYALRMYAQVEFRLKLLFSRYFWYNIIISAGYIVGLGLYFITGQWLLIFVVGELLALVYSFFIGDIFKRQASTGHSRQINKNVLLILLSTLIRDGVTQFDKVMVEQIISPGAVTEYHAVSLIAKTMQMLVTPINTLILSYLTVKDTKISRKAFNKFVLYGLGFGAFFYGVCLVGTPVFVKLFYGNLYDDVMQYNLLVNLALILGFVSNIFMGIMLSQGRTRMYTVIQTTWGVSYIGLSYWLATGYGLWGIIFSTLITNIAKMVVVLVASYKTIFYEKEISD